MATPGADAAYSTSPPSHREGGRPLGGPAVAAPDAPPPRRRPSARGCSGRRLSPRAWLREHSRSLAAPALAAAVIAASIAWSWVEYWGTPALALGGWALLAAKTCVAAAQACAGLMWIPMTRGLVARVRATRLRRAFDCDAAINCHAWLAGIGAAAGLAHGAFVTVAALVWAAKPEGEQARLGAPAPLSLGALAASRAFVTGLALVLLMAATFPFAMAWPRRAAWLAGTRAGRALNAFPNFWAAHHALLIAFPALLLAHAWPPIPTSGLLAGAAATPLQRALGRANKTAILLLPPLALYALDRCLRAWRSRSSAAPRVLSARLFPGGVLELVLSKPRGFKYSPGQYVHVACPALSPCEWHPFTLTSAPGDPHLALAIKAAGDWTAALLALVGEAGEVYGGRLVPAGVTWEAARAAATRGGDGGGGGGGGQPRPASAPPAGGCGGAAGAAAWPAQPALDSDDVEATAPAAGRGQALPGPHPAPPRAPRRARPATAGPRGRAAAHPGACGGDSAGSEAGAPCDEKAGGGHGAVAAAPGSGGAAQPVRRRRRGRAPPPLPPLPYSFRLDGPWGAPTQDFTDFDAVVLLGAGIGVTPMVSVLRALLHELNHARCPHCAHVNAAMLGEHTRVRRVAFTWLLPEVDGLAWFGRALGEIAAADGLGLMDLRIHLTRSGPATVGEEAGEGGGQPAAPAAAGDDGVGAGAGGGDRAGRSTFGGRLAALRAAGVRVHAGRPDFGAIIARAQAKAGAGRSVGVFFCGPGGLAREVRDMCRALDLNAGVRSPCGSRGGGGGGGELHFRSEVFYKDTAAPERRGRG